MGTSLFVAFAQGLKVVKRTDDEWIDRLSNRYSVGKVCTNHIGLSLDPSAAGFSRSRQLYFNFNQPVRKKTPSREPTDWAASHKCPWLNKKQVSSRPKLFFFLLVVRGGWICLASLCEEDKLGPPHNHSAKRWDLRPLCYSVDQAKSQVFSYFLYGVNGGGVALVMKHLLGWS